jgi:hypothetical protein
MSDDKVDTLQPITKLKPSDTDSDNNVKVIYKRPDYLRESQRKHYNKNKDNPEFMEKQRARIKKYREENRERVNELARLRRRKKKDEKEALKTASQQATQEIATDADAITDKMEKTLNIKGAVL